MKYPNMKKVLSNILDGNTSIVEKGRPFNIYAVILFDSRGNIRDRSACFKANVFHCENPRAFVRDPLMVRRIHSGVRAGHFILDGDFDLMGVSYDKNSLMFTACTRLVTPFFQEMHGREGFPDLQHLWELVCRNGNHPNRRSLSSEFYRMDRLAYAGRDSGQVKFSPLKEPV